MLTKNDVITRLDKFKTYSITQKPKFEEDYAKLMQPLYTAVNNYFSYDRSKFAKPLNELAEWLHNELWQKQSKWEVALPKTSSNAPASYSDLTKLFYTFDWTNTSNEDFYKAWVYETVIEPSPSSNPLIDKWITQFNGVYKAELENIDILSTYLYESMSNNNSFMLWEDTGTLLSAPETKDLAKVIFIDRKLLEVVKALNISIYIPTYLRGG